MKPLIPNIVPKTILNKAYGGANYTITGDTISHLLTTFLVPGSSLGPNGSLEVLVDFSTTTNNANTKTVYLRYANAINMYLAGLANWSGLRANAMMRNLNDETKQLVMYNGSTGLSVHPNITYGNIDSRQDQLVYVFGTLAVATDNLTLEGITARIWPGVG